MFKINLYALLLLFFLSTNAYSDSNEHKEKTGVTPTETVNDNPQKLTVSLKNRLIAKARKITMDYKLSPVKQECLTYRVQKNLFEGKHIIDVSEIHSKACGGDTKTAPRLFTIAIVEATGEVWSDARSMLGQLEKLDTP